MKSKRYAILWHLKTFLPLLAPSMVLSCPNSSIAQIPKRKTFVPSNQLPSQYSRRIQVRVGSLDVVRAISRQSCKPSSGCGSPELRGWPRRQWRGDSQWRRRAACCLPRLVQCPCPYEGSRRGLWESSWLVLNDEARNESIDDGVVTYGSRSATVPKWACSWPRPSCAAWPTGSLPQ